MQSRTSRLLVMLFPVGASGTALSAPISHVLRLQYDGRAQLAVSGRWSVPAAKMASSEWSFYLSPVMGEVKIDRVSCGKSPRSIRSLAFTDEGGDRQWKLAIGTLCAPGEKLHIAFHYRVERNAPQLRVTGDGAFAGGGGELWYPQESFRTLDTAVIRIVTPVGFTSIGTGDLIRRVRRGDRIETTFQAANPSKLAFAIGRYSTATSLAPFPMKLLAVPPVPNRNNRAKTLSRLLAPLQAAFGPAPQRSLALVEVKFGGKVAGTSEYGMIFAERSKIVGVFDPAYWGHEFAHQWWGVSIHPASGSTGAVLLTEGMAQYGASLALEVVEGEAAAAEYRRIDLKDSLAAYQRLVQTGTDRPLVGAVPNSDDEILIMHHLATSKGGILLSQLEWLIGRPKFQSTLRAFLAAHRGTSVSWSDLEGAINAATGSQYAWWFNQWLRRAGAPSFTVQSHISGSDVDVRVHQEQAEPYHLLIPIWLCTQAGERKTMFESTSTDARLTVHADAPITKLLVDPDMVVPNLDAGALAAVDRHTCS